MPVVVIGAGGLVGRALLRRLAGTAGEVRALVRSASDRDALAPVVPKVAIADLEDVETLSTMLHDAHTVVHLAGGLDLPDDAAYARANLSTVEWMLEAAAVAHVRRVVLLSYPGAASGSSNPYLRAKGLAEEAIASSGMPEAVIVRSAHVYGPGSRWLAAMRAVARAPLALFPGTGSERIAPIFAEDAAAALAAADDRAGAVTGTFGLQGPDTVTPTSSSAPGRAPPPRRPPSAGRGGPAGPAGRAADVAGHARDPLRRLPRRRSRCGRGVRGAAHAASGGPLPRDLSSKRACGGALRALRGPGAHPSEHLRLAGPSGRHSNEERRPPVGEFVKLEVVGRGRARSGSTVRR